VTHDPELADATAGSGDTASSPPNLSVPDGSLLRARTVRDLSVPLSLALDQRLTGYLRVECGGAILLDDATRGVVTLADGVPVLAYEVDNDATGPDALAELAGPGPVRVETYRVAADALAALHERAEAGEGGTSHDGASCSVAPDAPARQLADDPDLADRTCELAPAERQDRDDDSALASFLADEERVAAIRTEARAEARQRAEEWGLTSELAVDDADLDVEVGGDTLPEDLE
jgi:hypothetical protein